MQPRPIRTGLASITRTPFEADGGLCTWRGETCYRISEYDALPPFLMSVVSDCDLWMYVASGGGLTAGRIGPQDALFPYETVDKLFHSHHHTGPRTIIRLRGDETDSVWEPFAPDGRLRYEIRRSLYKDVLGCAVWFEERNGSLGLTFRYGWRPGRRFGWTRTAEILNDTGRAQRMTVLDGVHNLMPAGVATPLQDAFSCLVDAYKTIERTNGSRLAVCRLTANITDRPEASEALRVAVAWSAGLEDAAISLGGDHRDGFIRGVDPGPEERIDGRRGAYVVCGDVEVPPGGTETWHIVLDTAVDHAGVARLEQELAGNIGAELEADIARSRQRLERFMAAADSPQATGDSMASAHHGANVLFNIARGGVLPSGYRVQRDDVARVIGLRNRRVAGAHAAWLAALPPELTLSELQSRADAAGDRDLARICGEYLPIVFSRRHGDPSRPWNRFTIAVDNPDGSLRYAYEGNWRDIFQNWEALCRSFPVCIESAIARFVNASTMDGFNPYRITDEGVEWEVPDPGHPWSSLGYWGDHQIIYLLRLMEASVAHHPGRLAAMLSDERFSYADVPYDILPWNDIVANPQRTIQFNRDRQRRSEERARGQGTDGRLVHRGGAVVHVTLAEKLLVPVLAKVANLVPGGGVWLNTMRPEWNDANNALAGNGMSVVTACHLHRHLALCAHLFEAGGESQFRISEHVSRWLSELNRALESADGGPMDDTQRRAFLDAAGASFSRYREKVYSDGPGDGVTVDRGVILRFLRHAGVLAAANLQANRRDDGLYHAYNILHLGNGTAGITRLPLMLEGQVAALSSGVLAPEEAVALLDALRASALYSDDQRSYLLYPRTEIPPFEHMNAVPDSILRSAPALASRLTTGDRRILTRDVNGRLHFNADLHNAAALETRLDDALPDGEKRAIRDAYEAVFRHKSFMGRSQTMYRYEGIGCIYWHMVAKLALAVRELLDDAVAAGAAPGVVDALQRHYRDIRSGLGFTKSPREFGALPLDPYSHTPGFGGASQPGMTGQVKEEILARWSELGIGVRDGNLVLDPSRVEPGEFLATDSILTWIDNAGSRRSIPVRAGELAFTYCGIPVVYGPADTSFITIHAADGTETRVEGNALPAGIASRVFARDEKVTRISVHCPRGA